MSKIKEIREKMIINMGSITITIKDVVEWIVFLGAAILLALFINSYIIFNAHIPSASMENTIMTGDRVIGLRLPYKFGEPSRFDIAIFLFPDDETQYYVKRVIGMPGEKVEIIQGKVYINDSSVPLIDSFVKEPPYMENFGPYLVPPDSYFMLGDNRNNSKDSRLWDNKFVEKKKIMAKAWMRVPLPSFFHKY